MRRIVVAGIGTNVGKTVVAAIITEALQAAYWKPIQCGELLHSDSQQVERLVSNPLIFPEAYRLSAPLSPHHAALLSDTIIDITSIIPPQSHRPLVIEGAGGLLVPLTFDTLQLDLYADWDCEWILVAKHYLGSINHTLLSLEALQRRQQRLLGIVFNGAENAPTEQVILARAMAPFHGKLRPHRKLDRHTIREYAELWKPALYGSKTERMFGIPTHRH